MDSFHIGPQDLTADRHSLHGFLLAGAIALIWLALPAPVACAAIAISSLYEARSIPTAELGISRPTSLAFSSHARTLLIGQPIRRHTVVLRLGLLEQNHGKIHLPALSHSSALSFDPLKRRLTAARRDGLVSVSSARQRGGPRFRRIRRLKLGSPQDLTFDRRLKAWLILDDRAKAIVRVPARGGRPGRVTRTSLRRFGHRRFRGIAFNPADRLTYVLSKDLLLAVDASGKLRRTISMAPLRLADPRAIVFAPSGDPTDRSATLHLYIADRGARSGRGRIVESAFGAPSAFAPGVVEEVRPAHVQTIATSAFRPASPDPAGIVYMAAKDRFMISDSEVNEMTLYKGANLFTATRSGFGVGTGTTRSFSNEPTGLGFNPSDGTLFVSDDDAERISVIRPGTDGAHGTSDDIVTRFSTAAFGSRDAEGVEYDPVTGHLFICDGLGREVYRIHPVGGFGGGNDLVTSFDLARYGARDCEGIGLDPQRGTLLAVEPRNKRIYELTRSGELVRMLDLSAIGGKTRNFAGVTMAPTSEPGDSPSAMNYWVVDRQVDNGADPSENDGLLYELSAPPRPVAVTRSAGPATVTGR